MKDASLDWMDRCTVILAVLITPVLLLQIGPTLWFVLEPPRIFLKYAVLLLAAVSIYSLILSIRLVRKYDSIVNIAMAERIYLLCLVISLSLEAEGLVGGSSSLLDVVRNLLSAIESAIGKISLWVLLHAYYRRVRGGSPDFNGRNLIFELSFGQAGESYDSAQGMDVVQRSANPDNCAISVIRMLVAAAIVTAFALMVLVLDT